MRYAYEVKYRGTLYVFERLRDAFNFAPYHGQPVHRVKIIDDGEVWRNVRPIKPVRVKADRSSG